MADNPTYDMHMLDHGLKKNAGSSLPDNNIPLYDKINESAKPKVTAENNEVTPSQAESCTTAITKAESINKESSSNRSFVCILIAIIALMILFVIAVIGSFGSLFAETTKQTALFKSEIATFRQSLLSGEQSLNDSMIMFYLQQLNNTIMKESLIKF